MKNVHGAFAEERGYTMKKALSLILAATMLTCGLCGCKKNGAGDSKESTKIEVHDSDDPEVEAHNRKILAEELGWEEDDEYLKYQLIALKKGNAGMIQSAEYHEEDIGRCMTVIGEDGTEFLILLNNGDSVDAAQNVTPANGT